MYVATALAVLVAVLARAREIEGELSFMAGEREELFYTHQQAQHNSAQPCV